MCYCHNANAQTLDSQPTSLLACLLATTVIQARYTHTCLLAFRLYFHLDQLAIVHIIIFVIIIINNIIIIVVEIIIIIIIIVFALELYCVALFCFVFPFSLCAKPLRQQRKRQYLLSSVISILSKMSCIFAIFAEQTKPKIEITSKVEGKSLKLDKRPAKKQASKQIVALVCKGFCL